MKTKITLFMISIFLFPTLAFRIPLSSTQTPIAGGDNPGAFSAPTSNPLAPTANYPADPTSDIAWSAGTSGVADIQAAFNHARAVENSQLGTSTPAMTMPSQSAWDALSEGQQAVWLINRERTDRGILRFYGLEANVRGVAQAYADYLLAHNVFGHNYNGTPFDRMNAIPAISACHQLEAENLAVRMSSVVAPIALAVEQDVYDWIYADSGSAWGHRHNVLWSTYINDSGQAGNEGFLGIGRAKGGPYLFMGNWAHAEITVMDAFDPCSTWVYPSTSHSISGRVFDNFANPLAGVTISGGAAGSTTTNGSGNYTLSGVADGNYTLTPTLSGYTFSPHNRPVHVAGANLTLQDFIGTPNGSPAAKKGFVPVAISK